MGRCLKAVCLLFAGAVTTQAADPNPPDLAQYKNTKSAQKTQIQKLGRMEGTSPGHLGISVVPENGQLTITDVEWGSSAAKAGLKFGDKLRSINNASIVEIDDLRRFLQAKRAGDELSITIMRAGQWLQIACKLNAVSNPLQDPSMMRAVIGIQLLETEKGVKVEGFSPGSNAEEAGIRVGDVITIVDGAAITKLESLRTKLIDRKPGETVKLSFQRDDRLLHAAVPLISQAPAEDMPTLARWDPNQSRVFRRPVYRLAVIPIAFGDVKPNEKISTSNWDAALFSVGQYTDRSPTGQPVFGSLNDYYREISCGKFSIQGRIFDCVTVDKKRQDYMQVSNRSTLLTEACDQLTNREGADALKEFDGIFFIYSGNRVSTQRGGIFWPHKSNFSYKGKRWNYFICAEGGQRMSSISVICHEFGHMLGLPDLYARPETPGSEGLGVWCTMSTGHGQDGKPLHFSAWCKEQMGWIQPAMIDPRTPQKLLLAPIESNPGECFKILIRGDGSEYLLLENRIKKGFDRDLPGEGLLIWRVVDGKPILEESHGVGGPEGPRRFLGAVPYPSSSNRSYTPDSTPSSRPSTPGGWPVHISNIRRLEDGRIAFQVGYEYL